jgi:hypothetical protein
VGCPRNQTTAAVDPNVNSTIVAGTTIVSVGSASCGDMVYRVTAQHFPARVPADSLCTDLWVYNADNGKNLSNPFGISNGYSLEISDVDFEDATGHALSLYPNQGLGQKVNDVYIHNSRISNSAVTGLLYGTNLAPVYHAPVCDGNEKWRDDPLVYAPRNLRIEHNYFAGNNTGAMGGGAVRWVGLRDNTFTNNYIHPQAGNAEGGTVEFDPCADTLDIVRNTFAAPNTYGGYPSQALEVYSRNVNISDNSGKDTGGDTRMISGYSKEGITLSGVSGATVANNTIVNNATQKKGADNLGAGISVSSAQWILGPCGDGRDSRDITIGANNSSGQPFDVLLDDLFSSSTYTLRHSGLPYAVSVSPVNLAGGQTLVGQKNLSWVDGYSGPATVAATSAAGPRAVTPKAVWPSATRCAGPATVVQTFSFPAAHPLGKQHISWIQVMFSLTGPDAIPDPGPDNGQGGCHFIYYPGSNTVYLDGDSGGDLWTASSVVGNGGTDLSNSTCIIHAGSPPYPMAEPYISPNIENLLISVQFLPSAASSTTWYMYTIAGDDAGLLSGNATWAYFGWWGQDPSRK